MISNLIWLILAGSIAGWAAGKIMKGGSYGRDLDMLLGILGTVMAGAALGALDIYEGGFLGTVFVACVGAPPVIWIVRRLKKSWEKSTRELGPEPGSRPHPDEPASQQH